MVPESIGTAKPVIRDPSLFITVLCILALYQHPQKGSPMEARTPQSGTSIGHSLKVQVQPFLEGVPKRTNLINEAHVQFMKPIDILKYGASKTTNIGSLYRIKAYPWGSKYLLRRYLDPLNPSQTPSKKVLGALGYIIVDFHLPPWNLGIAQSIPPSLGSIPKCDLLITVRLCPKLSLAFIGSPGVLAQAVYEGPCLP